MARILVTGAGGFIGRALCPALAVRGRGVVAGLRRAAAPGIIVGAEPRILGDIAPERDWGEALSGLDLDTVIHLAQGAHRRQPAGTLIGEAQAAAALAAAAARAGVRRFLYLSSIKAMGETTAPGRPLRPEDLPRPEDDYGRAKLASERTLAAVAAETGLELVILRPPLVYGPGVGGNFRALLRLSSCGLPLPFAGVANRRSLIARDNLVDLIGTAATHPAAAGRVLLARDGADLSTPALIRILGAEQQRPARLFAVPRLALAALRRPPWLGPRLCRLTLSLQVDDGATRALFDWRPPVAAEAALRETARAFAAE
jgi:nucleoside-diphosphate-sugar epimerase